MRILFLSLLLIGSVSCGSDRVRCYECDLQRNGNYQDVGCFTRSEWDDVQFTDNQGNGGPLDKGRYCRVRN